MPSKPIWFAEALYFEAITTIGVYGLTCGSPRWHPVVILLDHSHSNPKIHPICSLLSRNVIKTRKPPTLQMALPTSWKWKRKLDEHGATDPLTGKLFEFASVIAKPYWCRQIRNLVPPDTLSVFESVVDRVKMEKLGSRPLATKVVPIRYHTAAWSMYPCSCQYRFAGFTNQKIGIIGSPTLPLHSNVAT